MVERRHQKADGDGDQNGAHTTAGDRHGGPDGRGQQAGLQRAQLIAGMNEEHIHRADSAAHVVGRRHLYRRVPQDDADLVGGSDECVHQNRQRQPGREAKPDGRHAVKNNAQQQGTPCRLNGRTNGEEGRHAERADFHGGRECTITDRAHTQNILGKYWQ